MWIEIVGNELSLNGLKMIFKSGKLVPGCFLGSGSEIGRTYEKQSDLE